MESGLDTDPTLPRWVEKLLGGRHLEVDADVPFQPQLNHVHRTWANTFISRPELYFQPSSVAQIQKIVRVAARCRRRVVVVGSGHSPSDLTCSSSWVVNLDRFSHVVSVDEKGRILKVEAGMRLRDLNNQAAERGWTIPSIGSIDEQSIAGAIATGTHGSSMEHGLLSGYVKGLNIVVGDGSIRHASLEENAELFRAALCSLGALGIVVQVEYQMDLDSHIEWSQFSLSLDDMLQDWNGALWTSAEFTRIWWMPHTRRVIVWRACKTQKPRQKHPGSWYGGLVGYHVYKSLLTVAHFVPRILPWIEWLVFGLQYGFEKGQVTSGVEPQREGLLMDCLYSQFVNEWAIPFTSGPDAIRAIDDWMHRQGCPPPVYVHAPIEVRVADTSHDLCRPYLDPSCRSEPTLFLNATLYRPYGLDPPCRIPYYTFFESTLSALGGRPHWAKNFLTVSKDDVLGMYGADLVRWRAVRDEVDPQGVFSGPWHRRYILDDGATRLECEESLQLMGTSWFSSGGLEWQGRSSADRTLQQHETQNTTT